MTQNLRYKCIVIDHDDTTFDSTASVHYPAYILYCEKYMKERTWYKWLSLEEWYVMLWDDGYYEHLMKDMKLTKEEMDVEYKMWIDYVAEHPSQMFEGFFEFLVEFRKRGGIIVVCSHGVEKNIRLNYEQYNFQPDDVYGSVRGKPELCKPFTYPIDQIKEKYGLKCEDICVIDDLYPGLKMAIDANVDALGVMYGKGHEGVEEKMKAMCKEVFYTVKDLSDYVLLEKKEE